MEEVAYYWRLTFKDGFSVDVPPQYVAAVKVQIKQGNFITTNSFQKPVREIASFDITDRRMVPEVKQLPADLEEEAARVFNEPLIADEVVRVTWVKKTVTKQDWAKFYTKLPAYRIVEENGTHYVIGFKVPTHLMDHHRMTVMSDNEVDKMY